MISAEKETGAKKIKKEESQSSKIESRPTLFSDDEKSQKEPKKDNKPKKNFHSHKRNLIKMKQIIIRKRKILSLS